MDLLKLIALDEDDLKIISAHLQDAVLKVGDMTFLPSDNKFVALMNRFNWLTATQKSEVDGGYERRRCAVRFDKVRQAQWRSLSLKDGSDAHELLAIAFEESDPPSGYITLTFAGGGAIRLQVDCIEVSLRDLGPSWETAYKPDHSDGMNELKSVS